MVIYEFIFSQDTINSAASTKSIHRTKHGAEIAMEENKKGVELSGLYPKEYMDNIMFWGVRKSELKD